MAEKPERDESASGQETAPLEAGRTLETEDPLRSNPNVSNSLIVAYVLWILLFPLGAHRFYLGRRKSAVVILLLSLSFFFSRFFLVSLPFPMLLDPET
ncbi:MAG: TM2 domain-containing protein, partial [Gammaproteobacteria bacterium]|nr:TM2 domain-containing protein [Gammaproteobacteria bacterium]